MQSFVAGVLIKVLSDPKVQEFIKSTFKWLLTDVIEERLKPLIPFALGSAMKKFSEIIPGANVIESAVNVAGNIQEDMDRMAESLPNTGVKQFDDFIDDFWGKN